MQTRKKVVFLPFPTYLLDKYTHSVAIAVFYAATLSVSSLCSTLIWEYAAFRHRLIPSDLDEKTILYNRGSGWMTLALFVLSIGLSFLSPLLARISWFAIILIRPLLLRLLLKEAHLANLFAANHFDAADQLNSSAVSGQQTSSGEGVHIPVIIVTDGGSLEEHSRMHVRKPAHRRRVASVVVKWPMTCGFVLTDAYR